MSGTPSYSLQSRIDRTVDHSRRPFPMQAVQGAILRKMAGYRCRRRTPLSRAELARWLAATPPAAVTMALADLVEGGRVRAISGGYELASWVVELRRADGSLVDRVHCDDIEQARCELADVERGMEQGETAVVRNVRHADLVEVVAA